MENSCILKRQLDLSGLTHSPPSTGESRYLHQYFCLSLCIRYISDLDKVLWIFKLVSKQNFMQLFCFFPLGKLHSQSLPLPLYSVREHLGHIVVAQLISQLFWFTLSLSVCVHVLPVYRSRPAVHLGTLQPGGEQAQKSLRQRHRLRPLPRHPGSHRG